MKRTRHNRHPHGQRHAEEMNAGAPKPTHVTSPSVPDHAEIVEIAPGLGWLRLPLPFHLNHVNIWVLDDGDAWTLIDCGANTEVTRQIWKKVLSDMLAEKPVRRVVATHGHVDHVGFAGPMHEMAGQPQFLITRAEWLAASLRASQAADGAARDNGAGFFAAHGFPDREIETATRPPAALDLLSPLPAYLRLVHGDLIQMGGREWEVIVAGGHAPEHASFYCRQERILIGGDQVLSPITPVIAVHHSEPDADPLGDYLTSLPIFGALSEETLVLPSHGVPFHGVRERVEALLQHHEERLDFGCRAAGTAANAYEVAHVCFPEAMKDGRQRLAFGETLAHLNHAANAGSLRRWVEGGTIRFGAV